MPGSVRVSVLEVVDLPLSLVGRTVQVRVVLGKKEYKTKPVRAHGGRTPPWNADFAFPVLNLRDRLSITIVGSRGETMTKTEIEVSSVVQNGFRDDFVALQGGGRIHLKLSFVLSEEERRRIEAMRVANQKKREQDALKARQNSAENGDEQPWKAAVSAVTITEMTAEADQEDKENDGRAGVVKQGKQQLKVAKPVAGGEEMETVAAVPLVSGESNVPVQQDAEEKGVTESADTETTAGEVIIDSQTAVPALEEEKSATTDVPAAGEPEVDEDAKASQNVGSEPSRSAVPQAAYPAEQVVVKVSSPAVVAAEPIGVVAADVSRAAPVTEEQFPLDHGVELENLLEGEMGEEWMSEWMADGPVRRESLEEKQVVKQAMDILTDKHEVEDMGPVQIADERIQVNDCSTHDKGMVEQEESRQVGGGATRDVEVAEEAILQEQAADKVIVPAVVEVSEAPLEQSLVAESNPQLVDKSLPFREQLKAIQQKWVQDDDDTGLREAPMSTGNSEERGDMSDEFQEQLRAIQERWNEASGFQNSDDESDGDVDDDEDTDATEFLGKSDYKGEVGEGLQEQLQAIEERWEYRASGNQGSAEDDHDGYDDNDGTDVQTPERDRPTEELVQQLKAIQKTWYVEDVSGLQGNVIDGETDEDENENDEDGDKNREDGADVQGLLSSSGNSEDCDQPSDMLREELKAVQARWEDDIVTASQARGNEADALLQDSVAPTRDVDHLEEKTSSSIEETTSLPAATEPVVSGHPPEEATAHNLTKSANTAREVENCCSQGNDGRRGPNFGAIVGHFFGGAAIVAGAAAVAWSFGSRKHHVVGEGETLGTFAGNSRFCKLNPGVCESSRVYPGQRLRLA